MVYDLPKTLSRDQAYQHMSYVLDVAREDEISDFLMATNQRELSADELTGFVSAVRARSVLVRPKVDVLLDTCGTGGDGLNTINVSTAAAIVAASAGIPVAKHGNYAISSQSGSADVMNALGYEIPREAGEAERQIEQMNFAFLLAPYFHPKLKRIGPIRKQIGRTVFNLLGPLCNPADVTSQVIGVYDGNLCEKICHVLKELGRKRALVVHGSGMDELSVVGETLVYELREDGKIESRKISPEDFGYERSDLRDLSSIVVNQLDGFEENFSIGPAYVNGVYLNGVFNGVDAGAKRNMIALNAGAAIYVAGKASSLEEGVRKAEELILSGEASSKMTELLAYQFTL